MSPLLGTYPSYAVGQEVKAGTANMVRFWVPQRHNLQFSEQSTFSITVFIRCGHTNFTSSFTFMVPCIADLYY